jgi:hypothetical protein
MRWHRSLIPQMEANLARQPSYLLDHPITQAQLAIARNEVEEARQILVAVSERFLAGETRAHDIRIRLLTAFLVIEDFSAASALLQELYGVDFSFGFLREQREKRTMHSGLWIVKDASKCSFLFNKGLFETDNVETVNRFAAWFELFISFLQSKYVHAGAVYADVGDVGAMQGLTACDYREGSFAVPDPLFCRSRGHEFKRKILAERSPSWENRIPQVFWRGTCTGVITSGWQSLQRIKLCGIARDAKRADLFDVAVAEFTQKMDDKTKAEIRTSGLMRPRVPIEEFGKYKYQIEIPGNGYSVSWQGLTHKLCTGSPVLKIPSPLGHVQWYFDRLKAWYNYVPIATDMSDLEEKAIWLKNHDDQARAIGARGRELMDSLDYEKELLAAASTISAALAHHSYQFGDADIPHAY